jgi:hypothetical protein
MGNLGEEPELLFIQEETLPVGERMCLVGTYDRQGQRLTARRSRLGPGLMAYRGSADEVLKRVGKDLSAHGRFSATLVVVGGLLLGATLVPYELFPAWMLAGSGSGDVLAATAAEEPGVPTRVNAVLWALALLVPVMLLLVLRGLSGGAARAPRDVRASVNASLPPRPEPLQRGCPVASGQ